MGSNDFRFYLNPNVDRDAAGNPLVITPRRLRFRHGNRIAVIEPRLPSKGERTWQCWVTNALAADMREMLTDWGADGPGWVATGNEANDKEHEDGAAYHVTIIAAFELEPWAFPACKMFSQDELMKAQGFKPGAEAKAANARDAKKFAADGVTPLAEVWSAAHTPPESSEARAWTAPIVAAMNRMEELGGSSSDADYLEVMDWVAIEAARRARDLRCQLDGRTVAPAVSDKRHTITIELEIEGDAADAADVVDNVLDNGTLQDAIHEYASDNDKDIAVTSAVVK